MRAARREVIEETGITQGVLVNLQWTQVYEILPAFGKVYAPGITRNLEHAFSLRLPQRVPVTLSDAEHVQFRWAVGAEAVETVSSSTNRAVIAELRLRLDAVSTVVVYVHGLWLSGVEVAAGCADDWRRTLRPRHGHFPIRRSTPTPATMRAALAKFLSAIARTRCTWSATAWAAW